MIGQQLARQLKYSGFPQDLKPGSKVFHEIMADPTSANPSDLIKIPTLDELTTACGDAFGGILKSDVGWIASGNKDNDIITATGDTPEIAVALLWLKLYKPIMISDSVKNMIRSVLEEVRLSNVDMPDDELKLTLADKNIFKGYNMAVQKQEMLIKDAIKKYI